MGELLGSSLNNLVIEFILLSTYSSIVLSRLFKKMHQQEYSPKAKNIH